MEAHRARKQGAYAWSSLTLLCSAGGRNDVMQPAINCYTPNRGRHSITLSSSRSRLLEHKATRKVCSFAAPLADCDAQRNPRREIYSHSNRRLLVHFQSSILPHRLSPSLAYPKSRQLSNFLLPIVVHKTSSYPRIREPFSRILRTWIYIVHASILSPHTAPVPPPLPQYLQTTSLH